jgi:histone H4
LKDTILGLSNASFRKLFRRAGVKRIGGELMKKDTSEARNALKTHLENVLRDSVTFCEHRRSKTVSVTDVLSGIESSSFGTRRLYW